MAPRLLSRGSSPPPEVIGFVVTRAALGAIELILPELAARWSCRRSRFDRRSTMVIRVLGGRQLAQAVLTYLAPETKVTAAGAAIDGIHALTMLGLAARPTRWRRPALVEAAMATVLSALGAVCSREMESAAGRGARWSTTPA